jgi:S1-C subfamily serine protease
MSNRVIIIIGIVAGLFMILLAGSAVGAGVIYYLTQSPDPVFAAQDTEPDSNMGLIVVSVDPGSPSEDAGIVRGDILLEIENREVNSVTEVVDVLGDFQDGDEVRLTVLHGDNLRTFEVTMETDYYPGALGIRLCCGIDEPFGLGRFLDPVQKPMIIEVIPDSPADDAGLQAGDVILSISGDEISPDESLADLIAEYDVGDEILMEIQGRGSRETTEVEVTLGEHPDEDGKAYLGIRFAPNVRSRIFLDDDVFPAPDLDGFEFEFEVPPFRRHFEFPFFDRDRFEFPFLPYNKDFTPFYFQGEGISGVIVQEVVEGSPAADAGLQPEDLITAVDSESLSDPMSFRDLIAGKNPGEVVSLTIIREEEELEIEVVLGEHPDLSGTGYLGITFGSYIHLGGDGFEHLPDDFHRYFQFDGFPLFPQPENPKPGLENQST